jgi:hypothetical protein
MRLPLAPCLLACALATGCAAPGPFPSLEPREVERIYAEGDPERPPPVIADDPAIAARVAALVAEGRGADGAFDRAIAAARPLVGRAGAAGSEGWIAAQQAISRAEAARAPTVRALADLDGFAVAEAQRRALSPGDIERLTAGTAALQALAAAQQEQLARLQESLRRS